MSVPTCNHCHSRSRYYDTNQNKLHDYCGKTCAEAATRVLNSQSCNYCHNKPKYNEYGKIHDYCGRTCAAAAGALKIPSNTQIRPATVSPFQHQLNYLTQLAKQGSQIDFYKKDDLKPMASMSLTAFLGNFHESTLELDGYSFPCSEALYQAAKFMNPDEPLNSQHNQSVLKMFSNGAINPSDGSSVGHCSWQTGQNSGFTPRSDWKTNNVSIMENILRLKYNQNPTLGQLLQATGNSHLNERTDRDAFWGDGKDGKGENQLGKCHERLRDEMNQNSGQLANVPQDLTAALLFNSKSSCIIC